METSIFTYSQESKNCEISWLSYDHNFFYYEGIVYQHAVEPDTTINDSCYKNVLRTMVEHVKRQSPLLRNGFLLHHDNTRPHIARCVLHISQQNNVEILPHPPCSLDLTPCDFWLVPQLKKNHYEANVLQVTKHV
ncbi:histone-lysine N-methyltransferase SETMAR [Trichonephila clavipes]|nr:histone-lysine N-methyltransferase SETMAR [Trichonephila clavipes]